MVTLLAGSTLLAPLLSKELRPVIRVAVQIDSAPVAGAIVSFNGLTVRTDRGGIATATVALGTVEIKVAKEGFLPGTTSLAVDEAREWQVTLELQRQASRGGGDHGPCHAHGRSSSGFANQSRSTWNGGDRRKDNE